MNYNKYGINGIGINLNRGISELFWSVGLNGTLIKV